MFEPGSDVTHMTASWSTAVPMILGIDGRPRPVPHTRVRGQTTVTLISGTTDNVVESAVSSAAKCMLIADPAVAVAP